jgi:hypothetical protein
VVRHFSNYEYLPFALPNIVFGSGAAMKLAPTADSFSFFWKKLEPMMRYNAHFEPAAFQPLLLTKSAEKVVAAVKDGPGSIFLLPEIVLNKSELITDKRRWTKRAEQIAFEFREAVLALDQAYGPERGSTLEPEWARSPSYQLPRERELQQEIAAMDTQIQKLVEVREQKIVAMEKSGSLRRLLYEKGPALEEAVREALAILGFDVSTFKDNGSEFDAVFQKGGIRFLGEIEGKDAKAVNVDKFSQLERNLHEDFDLEAVSTYAIGVLFGNGQRLLPLEDRSDAFTEKVLSAAVRSGVRLVRTADLFFVSRYLQDRNDPEFAAECRKALIESEGQIVTFPQLDAMCPEPAPDPAEQ